MTGWCRKFHDKEPIILTIYKHYHGNKTSSKRRGGGGGLVARMGETTNIFKVLVSVPKGKRSFRRYRGRWEDNIKIDFKGCGLDWTRLTQDRAQRRGLVNPINELLTAEREQVRKIHSTSFHHFVFFW
jgi:hypothetical protein